MRRQIGFGILVWLGAISALGQEAKSYRVEGVFPDAQYNGKVYITSTDTRQNLDSTIAANGRFVFEGTVAVPEYCQIRMGGKRVNFILEGGTIKTDFKKGDEPSGTPLNEDLRRMMQQTDSLFKLGRQESNKELKRYSDKAAEVYRRVFEAHTNDPLGVVVLSTFSREGAPLDEFMELYAQAGPQVRNHRIVKNVKNSVTALNATAVGKDFSDFTVEEEPGRKISLSDYVGKGNYVLADFWASWCGPCRREIPHLAELYNQYRDKGLVVLGIASWDKPEDTRIALHELGITWPQILNAQAIGTDIYGVSSIPQIILFGPDGTILARNLHGEEMKRKVAEVMSAE